MKTGDNKYRSEEGHLLERLSQGDLYAYECLFSTYYPQLVNFIDTFIGDREHARDMAQDVFLNVWNRHSSFGKVESFQAYIFKMAKCAVYNYFDHLLVSRKYVAASSLNAPVGSCSTEDNLFASQLESMLMEEVAKFPDRRKEIFLMSRIGGLDNDEIARRLGIDKRTVQNQISLCVSQLRKVLVCAIFATIIL